MESWFLFFKEAFTGFYQTLINIEATSAAILTFSSFINDDDEMMERPQRTLT